MLSQHQNPQENEYLELLQGIETHLQVGLKRLEGLSDESFAAYLEEREFLFEKLRLKAPRHRSSLNPSIVALSASIRTLEEQLRERLASLLPKAQARASKVNQNARKLRAYQR